MRINFPESLVMEKQDTKIRVLLSLLHNAVEMYSYSCLQIFERWKIPQYIVTSYFLF